METTAVSGRTGRIDPYKGTQFAMSLGYYWLLCWVDRTILAPLFGYQGLAYRSASPQTQICVLGLILLCTAITPVRYRRPSDGVLYMLLSLIVIPVLVIAATDVVFASVATGVIVSVAGAYVLLAACSMVPRLQGNSFAPLALQRPWIIAALLSVASYGLMFATFGIQFRLLSFSDVYNVRAVFIDQASGPLNYLLNWQSNVINPLFIVYGARFHRRLPLIAGMLGDFLIYTTTGNKSILFSGLAVIAIMVALHQKESAARPPAASVRIGFSFAALVLVAYSVDKISHSFIWTSLFVRRMSLVSGVNTGYYFQYFSFMPKTHLAYGLVGAILGNSGATPPPEQIAIVVYHTTVGYPNVNIWADAYANFGYFGVIVFTLILAGLLWLYDGMAQNVDRLEATVLITVPALTLANSALFTCLLTHGMLLSLLVITQWPRIVRQTDEPLQPQAGYGPSGFVGLTVR